MGRIYPTEAKNNTDNNAESSASTSNQPTVWTVWKKSSMSFQGTDGFSIFDSQGKLAFRVDNYSRRHKYLTREILLLDGGGKALLALRPQILSMHDRWNVYSTEECTNDGSKLPIFSVRRCAILQNTDSSQVFIGCSNTNSSKLRPTFTIDGCFEKRCCRVIDSNGREVAKISRKTTSGDVPVMLSDDVFSLILQPGVECQIIMALLVIMDRICHKSF
ncbi:protein LURP-one-related 5-like protein [Carex littledalei]|uniref:Protein LURP-one-related 5-like protein n=1 Tax=Carex littledalei TaxID=544730 RepID=A0A833Q9J3_9POAL|nr:protein LURP-one-related 5-like protein [Carex littledalei]